MYSFVVRVHLKDWHFEEPVSYFTASNVNSFHSRTLDSGVSSHVFDSQDILGPRLNASNCPWINLFQIIAVSKVKKSSSQYLIISLLLCLSLHDRSVKNNSASAALNISR